MMSSSLSLEEVTGEGSGIAMIVIPFLAECGGSVAAVASVRCPGLAGL